MNSVEMISKNYLEENFAGFEKIFLSVLSQMKLGRLYLELSNGKLIRFGQENFTENLEVARIKVNSEVFFKRCILFGDIGFGESYTLGEWESDDVTAVIRWMILNKDSNPGISGANVKSFMIGVFKSFNILKHFFRDNDLSGSVKNISAHYDLGNDFFKMFLDPTMAYSSGDFTTQAENLESAQIAKFERMAKSLQIQSEDHVLEIGSGWGGFAIYLAQNYQCKITTITISKKQYEFAKNKILQLGLSDKIDIQFKDYRKINGQYDKIVSIEMIEAVGHKHLPSFFNVIERCLKPNGLFGMQVITSADCRYKMIKKSVDWTQKHIFPGSLIPSLGALTDAARASSELQMHTMIDLGKSYSKTLKIWRNHFNSNSDKIISMGFDRNFINAWNYYFSYCEAAFETRHISVKQVLFTRPNNSKIFG